MDESFLSDKRLVEASRDFVCIRLATYESKEEAEFLQPLVRTRSGDLENTVFALMDPDATRTIGRTGRSPQQIYRHPGQLVDTMKKIAAAYPGKGDYVNRLPQMSDFRLALNVASCDGLPLVVAVGEQADRRNAMIKTLTTIAFGEALAGKFHYVAVAQPAELKSIDGFDEQAGAYVVVAPDRYGTSGSVVLQIQGDVTAEKLEQRLTETSLQQAKAVKHHHQHVREGVQTGHRWKTAIPVTDPGSIGAMKRMQRRQ